jgi:hypothetical protein
VLFIGEKMFKLFWNTDFEEYREMVPHANMMMNMSIEIDATPDCVYYFISRIGNGNGWFSLDSPLMLKNWFKPEKMKLNSSNVPLKRGSKLDFMHVMDVEEDRRINLMIKDCSGVGDASLYLRPLDNNRTLFISLARMRYKNFFWKYAYGFVTFCADYVLRKIMLKNIKRLAELKYQGKMESDLKNDELLRFERAVQ